MLHTKSQGHWPFGSGRRRLFTIYGHGGHLGHVNWIGWTNFCSPSHGGSIWNLTLIGPVVSEEMFENVDIHTYRWQRPTYPISSPLCLRLRWAKNEVLYCFSVMSAPSRQSDILLTCWFVLWLKSTWPIFHGPVIFIYLKIIWSLDFKHHTWILVLVTGGVGAVRDIVHDIHRVWH